MGDILELATVFRTLADAYAATSGGATTVEANVEGAERYGETAFSRLSVGLAVRQVTCPPPSCAGTIALPCRAAAA